MVAHRIRGIVASNGHEWTLEPHASERLCAGVTGCPHPERTRTPTLRTPPSAPERLANSPKGDDNTIEFILPVTILIIALLIVLSIVLRSWKNGIPPMPTSAPVQRKVVEELKRLSGPITRVVEAGSGWGTLANQIARLFPDWRIVGIENSPIPLAISWLIAHLSSLRNINYIRGNLYDYAYEHADVVVCYLYPGAMTRLDPIFRERLVSGAVVISICFALPGWSPERVVTCWDMYRTKIYIYKNAKL